MKSIAFVFLLMVTTSFGVFGQVSDGGLPYFWSEPMEVELLDAYILPGADAIAAPSKKISYTKGVALTFAELFDVNLSSDKYGKWTQLSNGDKIWEVKIISEGAYSLNVQFSNYLLPEGARLFIYNSNHTQVIGAFTHKNNKNWRGLATLPVAGDQIVIEYYEPAEADFPGELTIGTIGHDYLGIFGKKDGHFGVSDTCNIDINCSEGDDWQIQKRAVCRMITGGSQLCSGSLINNASKDQTPYILTANHCIDNGYLAQNTVFVFNYESPTCNGSDGSVSQSISGAELIATKNQDKGYLDFSLLRLSEKIPLTYKPYFAGWDSRSIIPDKATGIHHPWGDVKKISIDNIPLEISTYLGYGYDPQAHWKVLKWDAGTTQGGSSGSPLFNSNKNIVGCLSGGDANCISSVNDYYQMFSVAYNKYDETDSTQLKRWLDPYNTGIQVLDGYDPLKIESDVTDLISVAHWKEGQNLAFYKANEGGYLAGNNIYQDKAKAEYFDKNEFLPLNVVTGAYVAFGFASGRDNELIEMQVLKDNFGMPSTVLGSAFVTLGKIKENADKDYVYFSFTPPVEVTGSIYLSLVLPQYSGDTLALMTVEESVVNTAWELNYYNQWYPYSDPDNSWNIKLSHLIAMEIGRYVSIDSKNTLNDEILLYPNPAIENITLDGQNTSISKITVFDAFGKMIEETQFSANNKSVNMNVSHLKSGMYIIQLTTQKGLITKKMIKK